MFIQRLIKIIYLKILFLSFVSMAGTNIWNVTSNQVHEFQILNKGITAFDKRLRMIEKAEKSISIEYFIYNTDRSGRVFTQALIKKAEEGVEVRILLDHFLPSREITPYHAHELKKLGIKIRYYNPGPVSPGPKIQYRHHRKLFMVDEKAVIIGGRNIGDDYFDLSHHYNFLDRDLYIKGPIVEDMKITFNEYWESGYSKELKRPKRPRNNDLKYRRGGRSQQSRNIQIYKSDLRKWKVAAIKAKKWVKPSESDDELKAKIRDLADSYFFEEQIGNCSEVHFASDRPGVGAWTKKRRVLKHEVYKRMKNVKRELIIDSPYFLVSKETSPILKSLLEQNVKIDVLTNGLYSTDAVYVASVFNDSVGGWLKYNSRNQS